MSGNCLSVPTDTTINRFINGLRRDSAPRGKLSATALLGLVAVLGSPSTHAQAIYKQDIYECREKGRVIYTEEPTARNCRLMNLGLAEHGPDEIARLNQERQRKALAAQRAEQQAYQERLVHVRELEAIAAIRAARAAEAQANTLRNAFLCRRIFNETYVWGIDRIPLEDCFGPSTKGVYLGGYDDIGR